MREYFDSKLKHNWAPGPWHNEPDKIEWVDGATGLDCLMVRNNAGAWCGYVGVAEGHPAYGIRYSECIKGNRCPGYRTPEQVIQQVRESAAGAETATERCSWELLLKSYLSQGEDFHPGHEWSECSGTLESVLTVHGGITFSDWSAEPMTFSDWVARSCEPDWLKRAVAKGYDAGWTYPEYVDWHYSGSICHLPEEGRPTKLWWLGFDCAHCFDLSPGYSAIPGMEGLFSGNGNVYRDRTYVEAEVRELAKQLATMAFVENLEVLDELEL